MTAEELRDVFLSAEYRNDLEELSSYLASIKQERPIVYLLAKHLWKKGGHKFQLEAKLKDLVVNGKHIEFKVYYDCDMERLKKELSRYGDKPLKEIRDGLRARERSAGWSIALKIYEDICEKKPHIFVLVICSRDLSRLDPDERDRICWSTAQCKWSVNHAYSDPAYLAVADLFLEKLQAVRSFAVRKAEIATIGLFPSIYHFRICEIPG